MAERLQPDICVIGAGSGGLSVAAAAAAFGVSVALVEKDKMGGECLNTGCVPSKALIAAGKRAHALVTYPRQPPVHFRLRIYLPPSLYSPYLPLNHHLYPLSSRPPCSYFI